jgi:hypothetical protein
MVATQHKLEDLRRALEREAANPRRIELVRRAQRFKRSWVEMAEALVEVRRSGEYQSWGYDDFFAYCAEELQIRRATAEKLAGSYAALEQHAPEYLGSEQVEVPSYDAVDYFARAMGVRSEPANAPPASTEEPSDELARELRSAVFDEGAPVSVLRRRFDPVLYPKPEGAEELELLKKTESAAKRLANLLERVSGVPRKRVIETEEALEALRAELETAIPKLEAEIGYDQTG